MRMNDKGEIYRMMPNNYFKAMYGNTISSGRIKSYLDDLEEAGYISILGVRRPNKQLRFVKCNVFNDDGDTLYIPGDYIDQSIYLLYGMGLYIKTLSRNRDEYFEDYMDYFTEEEWKRIVREMVREKMFTEDGNYEATDSLTDIAKEFFDYWQSHKKDC